MEDLISTRCIYRGFSEEVKYELSLETWVRAGDLVEEIVDRGVASVKNKSGRRQNEFQGYKSVTSLSLKEVGWREWEMTLEFYLKYEQPRG